MRALQFTLRDLMWLTIVVALAALWWDEHERAAKALTYQNILFEENERLRQENTQPLRVDPRFPIGQTPEPAQP